MLSVNEENFSYWSFRLRSFFVFLSWCSMRLYEPSKSRSGVKQYKYRRFPFGAWYDLFIRCTLRNYK